MEPTVSTRLSRKAKDVPKNYNINDALRMRRRRSSLPQVTSDKEPSHAASDQTGQLPHTSPEKTQQIRQDSMIQIEETAPNEDVAATAYQTPAAAISTNEKKSSDAPKVLSKKTAKRSVPFPTAAESYEVITASPSRDWHKKTASHFQKFYPSILEAMPDLFEPRYTRLEVLNNITAFVDEKKDHLNEVRYQIREGETAVRFLKPQIRKEDRLAEEAPPEKVVKKEVPDEDGGKQLTPKPPLCLMDILAAAEQRREAIKKLTTKREARARVSADENSNDVAPTPVAVLDIAQKNDGPRRVAAEVDMDNGSGRAEANMSPDAMARLPPTGHIFPRGRALNFPEHFRAGPQFHGLPQQYDSSSQQGPRGSFERFHELFRPPYHQDPCSVHQRQEYGAPSSPVMPYQPHFYHPQTPAPAPRFLSPLQDNYPQGVMTPGRLHYNTFPQRENFARGGLFGHHPRPPRLMDQMMPRTPIYAHQMDNRAPMTSWRDPNNIPLDYAHERGDGGRLDEYRLRAERAVRRQDNSSWD